MKIIRELYNELIEMKEHEACGIVSGIDGIFSQNHPTQNKAKEENRFKIGFFEKISIAMDIIRDESNVYALYHVHNRSLRMSKDDTKNAKLGSYNIIIANGKLKMYQILKHDGKKIFVEEPLEIV